MKKTCFAAFVAAVALLATSCTKEMPKAVFTYEVEELTVTFTNLSTNADSYTWEFGDGQTSTEKNPIHTYAENGTYNVVLTATNKDGEAKFSDAIIMKTAAVKVDGQFTDWETLMSKGTAAVSALDAGKENAYKGLTKMAWYADEDYIYMYFEYDAAQTAPLDVMIGTKMIDDGDKHATHLWNPCYCDKLIEFGNEGSGDWTDWSMNVLFDFDHEVGGWSFSPKAEKVVEVAKANGKMEGRVSRVNFEFTDTYFYVAAFTSNADWAETGVLPAVVVNEGVNEYSEMLKVNL